MDRQTRRTANTQLSLDSMHEGRVVRIEDYGAFVQIGDRRGLVHISQLASMRVEKVTDVLDINDNVWVKVIDVEVAEGGRDKLRLTMKNVPQDGTAIEAQESERRAQGLSKGIEQNLNSTIGMAVARDPMAKGLILKQSGAPARIINGYALLDEEAEDDLTPSNVLAGEPKENFKEKVTEVKPIGRGRGATLPAWMVAGQAKRESDSNKNQFDRSKKSDKKKKRKKENSRDSKKHSKSSRKKRRRSESSDSIESYRRDRDRTRGSSDHDGRRRYSSRSDSSADNSHRVSDRHHNRSRQRRRHDDTGSYDRERASEPFASIKDARRYVEQMEERKSRGNSGAT
jgi:predicted RNA-binding protein with RPS1 domain